MLQRSTAVLAIVALAVVGLPFGCSTSEYLGPAFSSQSANTIRAMHGDIDVEILSAGSSRPSMPGFGGRPLTFPHQTLVLERVDATTTFARQPKSQLLLTLPNESVVQATVRDRVDGALAGALLGVATAVAVGLVAGLAASQSELAKKELDAYPQMMGALFGIGTGLVAVPLGSYLGASRSEKRYYFGDNAH